MKGIDEIRRENLRALIGERYDGDWQRAAVAFEFEQPNFIYRILPKDPTKRPTKSIGKTLARKLERIGGKPLHWLDAPRYSVARGGAMLLAQEAAPRQVPVIRLDQAEHWKLTQQITFAESTYTTEYASENAYAIRVPGDSMTSSSGEESFPENTLIVLDPEREAAPGDFVIARQRAGAELTFKQLVRDAGRLYLKPLNPQYPMVELGADGVLCGVLIQSTRVHRRQ